MIRKFLCERKRKKEIKQIDRQMEAWQENTKFEEGHIKEMLALEAEVKEQFSRSDLPEHIERDYNIILHEIGTAIEISREVIAGNRYRVARLRIRRDSIFRN